MIANNFIDLDLSKLEIPENEKLYWDECKILDGFILVTKCFATVSELSEKWEQTVHFTAGYIQNNLETLGLGDESAWDMYVVFMCQEATPDILRLKIEQNKFCCKKYVYTIKDGENQIDVLNARLPLFCKWSEESSESNVYVGGKNSNLRERLADGLDSRLADILRSNEDFAQKPANEIVSQLLLLK